MELRLCRNAPPLSHPLFVRRVCFPAMAASTGVAITAQPPQHPLLAAPPPFPPLHLMPFCSPNVLAFAPLIFGVFCYS